MSSSVTNDLSQWPPINDTPGGYPTDLNEPGEWISNPQSLSQAVKARKAEYVRKKTVKVKIGTWNVASISGTEKDLGAWFVDGKGIHGLAEDLSGAHLDEGEASSQKDQNKPSVAVESVSDQEDRWQKQRTTVPKDEVAALPGGRDIGLYVLGLQEVVDVSSPTGAIKQYTDTTVPNKWKRAMEAALHTGYQKVAEEQLLGLLILIYASAEVAPSISSVSTTSVGTGLLGKLGNKGAVSARLVLGETTRLVFVDCHLAAGNDKTALERRNWDAAQVVSRTHFDPITDITGGTEDFRDGIGDEDFGFWFGDLNYRLEDMPGDDVRRLLLLHTKNEYDLNNKSKRKIDSELGYISAQGEPIEQGDGSAEEDDEDDSVSIDPKSDPASLQTTLQSLLSHDQLRLQQKKRKAFYDGWREGEIDFLPTYKYDVGSVGMFDSGEKKRSPSWCDRILFRTRQDRLRAIQQVKQEEEDHKKDEEMKARGIEEASRENDILFDYDPENDGTAEGDDYDEHQEAADELEVITTKDGFEDTISLDHYSSHQRVLSSDHKPLDAVFTLEYDAVVPELKAKVYQAVAKQLDKAENEGRPTITIVIEQPHEGQKGMRLTENDTADTDNVDFGDVRYQVKSSRSLTLANTGSVIATLAFIDRPVAEGDKAGMAPPWLMIEVDKASKNTNLNPSALREYSLEPGETVNVDLTVNIDDLNLVRKLNQGAIQLDDVLVLRVNDGRDHFIPVRGRWMPSCLCRSIDDLVIIPAGQLRKQQPSKSTIHGGFVSKDGKEDDKTPSTVSESRVSAPRELFALTEAIQELATRTLAEWDMTHDSSQAPPWAFENGVYNGWPFNRSEQTSITSTGRPSLLATIFEALDTSEPLKDHLRDDIESVLRLEALGEALMLFLSSLEDGIITSDMWKEIDDRLRDYERQKTQITGDDMQSLVLETLSTRPAHSVSFTFLQFMLTRLINEMVPPSQSTSIERDPIQIPPSPDQQALEAPSPSTKSAASVFSSLSLRGRRTRSNTLSSTASSNAPDTPGSSTAPTVVPPPSEVDRRSAMVKAYCLCFADHVIRSSPAPAREKERKVLSERKQKVMTIFLQ